MFVCVCKAVSDRTIDQAIANHGPCPDTVAFETGAGTGCGRCRSWIEQRCAHGRGEPALPTVPLSVTQETMYGRAQPTTPSIRVDDGERTVHPATVVPRPERCV